MNKPASAFDAHTEFVFPENIHYANHATLSPWPRCTADAVSQYASLTHQQGPLVYAKWMENDRQLRQLIARLIGAGSMEDIALMNNTSAGINTVARGLEWQPGDNIVTVKNEFPSNHLPWKMLARHGVELRTVNLSEHADPEGALIEAMDDATRLLALSSVQWIDGFRMDLDRLGAACKARKNTLFFIDAIQHLGALRVGVEAQHVDILSAGSHKWQMGPEGMAVFYCNTAAREALQLTHFGWHMLERRFEFEQEGRSPVRFARRFEAGTPNRIGEVALFASLSLLERIGMAQVEKAVLDNTAALMDCLGSLDNIQLLSDPHENRRSGIVSFRHANMDTPAVVKALRSAGIVAAQRGLAVRLSPHFYQAGGPMDSLIEVLRVELKKLDLF